MSASLPTARRLGRALLLVVAQYCVARGLVEVATVNPTRPETYRLDWGGPHYLGVLLVRAGPGLLVVILTVLHYRRRSGAGEHSRNPGVPDR